MPKIVLWRRAPASNFFFYRFFSCIVVGTSRTRVQHSLTKLLFRRQIAKRNVSFSNRAKPPSAVPSNFTGDVLVFSIDKYEGKSNHCTISPVTIITFFTQKTSTNVRHNSIHDANDILGEHGR